MKDIIEDLLKSGLHTLGVCIFIWGVVFQVNSWRGKAESGSRQIHWGPGCLSPQGLEHFLLLHNPTNRKCCQTGIFANLSSEKWYLRLILIYISLTREAEYLFIHLKDHLYLFLCKPSVHIFYLFPIWVFGLFLLIFINSLYFREISFVHHLVAIIVWFFTLLMVFPPSLEREVFP